MIIFCDGSSSKIKHEHYVVSWGIKIEHSVHGCEIWGTQEVDWRLHGCHESFAFIESVVQANARGAKPEEVVFYTDDEAVAYGAYDRSTGWEFNGRKADFDHRLNLLSGFYSDETLNLVREYSLKSRFVKVKGHKKTVNNLRVDYLAAQAKRTKLGACEPFQDFETWLGDGFKQWTDGTPSVWYPPFA